MSENKENAENAENAETKGRDDTRVVVNQFENLKVAFPYMRNLDPEFYTQEPYKSNRLRRCKIMVFLGALSNYDGFRALATAEQNALIRRIESGCVNETIRKCKEGNVGCSWQTVEFTRQYSTIVLYKAQELDYTLNEWLVTRVVSGEINPANIAGMNEEECNPDALHEMLERRKARLASKIERKKCSGYPCPQCCANGPEGFAYITNVQTRGLDEAKVTRAECCACGHIWEVER